MRATVLVIIMLLSFESLLAQQPNVAVIVEEHSDKFDFIFYCKIGFLVILGIVAIASYVKFYNQENSKE